MSLTRAAVALVFLAGIEATASAGDFELPYDVGVTLTASPTDDLVPGQPVDMTLSVTNHGSGDLSTVLVTTSVYVDEMQFVSINADECFLFVVVGDLAGGGYDYRTEWWVALPDLAPPIAGGETRVCHFQIALTALAPAAYTFSFGLPDSFHDPDPSNDRPSVTLHRAAAAPAQVPALSAGMLWLLAALSATVGMLALRRDTRTTRSSSRITGPTCHSIGRAWDGFFFDGFEP
jgi:hypothetical protein